ncbi:Far upstream element-binding protein 3 [Mactra antiquata]
MNKVVILGVAVPTVLGLLYLLWKTRKDEEEETERPMIVTSHQTVIELPIPRKVVGTIIGRQGSNIKQLQERAGVRMNFKAHDDKEEAENRILQIRGSAKAAQTAECLVREIIAEIPEILQEEIKVPRYCLGRIIGRGGETVRQLSRTSSCKIYIDRSRGGNPDEKHLITLTGTKDQILLAKSLLQEKIDDEDKLRAEMAVAAANRETRDSKIRGDHSNKLEPSLVSNESSDKVDEDWDNDDPGKTQLYLTFPKERKYVEVYVSAIADMEHFWIQTIGAMALQLDRLSQQMTFFYESEGQSLTLGNVKKGDIIAAPFENDKTWYRAKVMDVKDDQRLDVFYLDYGDSAYIDSSTARSLRDDFLTLPFQAIECCLAGVKSNGEWSEAAFEKFECLTYCAKWKVLIAEAVNFTNSIPHLILMDTNGTQDININAEMVKSGFAVTNS